jgi:hypothetical protein
VLLPMSHRNEAIARWILLQIYKPVNFCEEAVTRHLRCWPSRTWPCDLYAIFCSTCQHSPSTSGPVGRLLAGPASAGRQPVRQGPPPRGPFPAARCHAGPQSLSGMNSAPGEKKP